MLGILPEPAATAVAAFTGAGKGEIHGLLWEDYDGFSIRVKQAEWRICAYGCLRISSYLFCRKNCKIRSQGRWKYLDVSEL
jgi:hypothetical protein